MTRNENPKTILRLSVGTIPATQPKFGHILARTLADWNPFAATVLGRKTGS